MTSAYLTARERGALYVIAERERVVQARLAAERERAFSEQVRALRFHLETHPRRLEHWTAADRLVFRALAGHNSLAICLALGAYGERWTELDARLTAEDGEEEAG